MTVYEIPNIEHCTVTEKANGLMYLIQAHEGWYIHLNDDVEDTANLYKRSVGLSVSYDFSLVQIIPESELPTDAEIAGVEDKPEIA